MQKERLYKRDNTGKVRVWSAEIDGERYRLHSGQLDGKIITSNWTTCEGKNIGRSNATTPAEQARTEVDSLYTKKKKRGYTENKEAIDQVKKSLIGVMLAHDYADHRLSLKYPHVYCQPKLDGIRCIARPDGLWTRKGERITTVPHIEEEVVPLCAELNCILDGELYNHKLKDDFNEITSLVRRQKTDVKHDNRVRAIVQYHIYDLVHQGMRFNDRSKQLQYIHEKHMNSVNFIKFVKTRQCDNLEDLDYYYERYLEQGYEGQMVRTDTEYEFKRTSALLKRKEFKDEEFRIVDVIEGRGNRSGMVGALMLYLEEGKTFNASVMGTNEYRVKLLKNSKQLIGKLATVKYFHKTSDGIPRFPVVKHIHKD